MRVHAFEFNDSAWCPRFVRDAIVEALGLGLRWSGTYAAVAPTFAEFCERAGCGDVLDLCTGSGEPVSILIDGMRARGLPPPRFTVSDLFPNVETLDEVAARYPGLVDVVRESVDATAVPSSCDRPARTVVSAFHHFPPALARAILADAVAKRRAVFVLEAFPRDLLHAPSVLLNPVFVAALLANPWRCARSRALKVLFTYLLPVIPVVGFWDGVVSNLRIYDEASLRAMVEPLGGGYTWEYRTIPFPPLGRASVFFGVPQPAASSRGASRSEVASAAP